MPLERKLLSKRHLRRKRAQAINQIRTLSSDVMEKNIYSSSVNAEDNKQLHITEESQACTVTNKDYNVSFSPLFLRSQSQPHLNLGVSSDELSDNSILQKGDNREICPETEYNQALPFPIAGSRLISAEYERVRNSSYSDSSSDDHDYEISLQRTFQTNLRKWACNYNITHTAVDELLTLIHPKYPFLPKCAKTLMNTKRSIKTYPLKNGEMSYIGIRKELERRLKGGLKDSTGDADSVIIDINIDGLPLFKSSSVNLWPILCRSDALKDSSPFMVAVFCGKGKPDSLESFLSEFIEEMDSLLEHGIRCDNKIICVKIGCFLCDAPARAWLKMIKGHTSTFGCEKCTIAAVSLQRKLYYPVDKPGCRKRCDDDFLDEELDATHIKGISPLLRLFIRLVTQFPLDPMHLIFLGVVKRLLINYWIEGSRSCKLSKKKLKLISSAIETLRAFVTAEFIRKPRSLDEVKRWKATEFRFFLVYMGPIILRNVLDSEKYRHFLLLHTAIYILSNESLISRYLDVARRAIEKFVKKSTKLYGLHFVVYNVHSLLHVCDDVERYGKLQDFSCFPFENFLGKLKRRVRARKLPLQQVVKRLSELSSMQENLDFKPKFEQYIPKGIKANAQNAFECETLETNRFKLSSKIPDNIVAVNGRIYEIRSIICVDGIYKCLGIAFRYLRNLYRKPIESSKLGIFFAKSYAEGTTFLVDEIAFKCLRFPFKDGYGIFPILHQRDS